MTTVQFYQLLSTPFERAVPKLLEKAQGAGLRVQLVLENEARVSFMNETLWTYDAASFLPHGAENEANAEAQPIVLSTSLTPINAPQVMFVTHGQMVEDLIKPIQSEVTEAISPQSGAPCDLHSNSEAIVLQTMSPANHGGNQMKNMGGNTPHILERVIDLFDGRDESALTAARTRFAAYKSAGHSMAYFQQTATGGWEKKA